MGLRLLVIDTMPNQRIDDLIRFYSLLADLAARVDGLRLLAQCTGRDGWPKRGIYFFQEPGEQRSDTGIGSRIVRVGTHALKAGSRTSIWNRLSQHRGVTKSGGGNHRGSIFRLIIGDALIRRESLDYPTWGNGSSAKSDIRDSELPLERLVSKKLGAMPFLWLHIDDEPGPTSARGYIERNAIALLSNFNKPPLDAPSPTWLGHCSRRTLVRESGLWNSNHVADDYDRAFLDEMESLIARVGTSR